MQGNTILNKIAERAEGDFIGEMAVADDDAEEMENAPAVASETRDPRSSTGKWVGKRRTASVRATVSA